MSNKFKVPATPLMVCDPFFSIWSMTDNLCDDSTRHWTGKRQNVLGLVVVDDSEVYRFMGKVISDNYSNREPFGVIEQKKMKILPMQTIYTFENNIMELELTFTSPLLLDDLNVLSRPVSYVDYKIKNLDSSEHIFKVIFAVNAEIAGDKRDSLVEIKKESDSLIWVGKGEDGLLSYSEDMCCADWGRFCLFSDSGDAFATSEDALCRTRLKKCRRLRRGFDNYKLSVPDEKFVCAIPNMIALEQNHDLKYTDKGNGTICVAFDDISSLMLFGEEAKCYCYKDGLSFNDICTLSVSEHDDIIKKVEAANKRIMDDAMIIGERYANIISLAYRQVIAAHKLVYHRGKAHFLSKECASNGCIGTVDVTYPSIPMFLLYRPELVFAMLEAIFEYEKSDMWPWDFAPHDVGRYPLANSQVYGNLTHSRMVYGSDWGRNFGDDPRNVGDLAYAKQMPVEECGNMIICITAACSALNDYCYAANHFDVLAKWADYLESNGLDPEDQLCTDDFAGHLAHNCNLSVKAIIALACFGRLCDKTGLGDGKHYINLAQKYAADWKKEAFAFDHYKLVFDKDKTWSMKYNMVWDKLLGLNVFDEDIIKTETEYYKKKVTKYGLPLDSRSDETKSDWQFWISAMSDDSEFETMIIDGVYAMLADTKDKVPFTDWYSTSDAKQCGFQNRTVQGGLFINILARKNILN